MKPHESTLKHSHLLAVLLCFVLSATIILILHKDKFSKPEHEPHQLTRDELGFGLGVALLERPVLNSPVLAFVRGETDSPSNAVLNVTLPDGINLLSGKLHYQAVYDTTNTLIGGEFVIQIIRPGNYELSADMYATKGDISHRLPRHRSLYFFVNNEGSIIYENKQEMEIFTMDSLMNPYNKGAISEFAIGDSLYWENRYSHHQPPLTTSVSLVLAAFRMGLIVDSLQLGELIRESHELDSIFSKPVYINPRKTSQELSIYTYHSKLLSIVSNRLFCYPPKLDKVESALKNDFRDRINEAQLKQLTKIVQRQLVEIYDLDQHILNSIGVESKSWDASGLKVQRISLLLQQNKERKTLLNSQP